MSSPDDVVTLERGDGCSLGVHLHGATVVSWKLGGEEMIFISTKSVFDNKKAIRGGIPVVFPNFGPWELGPQHGFARISRWAVASPPAKDPQGTASAVFILSDNETTKGMWNFKFELRYTITLLESGFTTSLQVSNKDDKPFDFTCLLHTYFKVPDVRKVTISGLQGLTYTDKVLDGATATEDRAEVTIAGSVDRVYSGTPDAHIITHVAGGKTITLTKTNLPDTVVWNPWMEKASAMADFGDEDYPHMVCVEAGHVSTPVHLQAGAVYTGSQAVTAQ